MIDLITALRYISPRECDYTEWVNVGMALKHEGYSCDVWDAWSKDDDRYHYGECERKWQTFTGDATPVTGGTIVAMAKKYGYQSPTYNGDEEIAFDGIIIDDSWVEDEEIEVTEENPVEQIITYLQTLFNEDEYVGYVTKSYENPDREGKYLPSKGNYDRTAGQLIKELSKCKNDVGKVFGDYNPEVGAWIRFNPLDGKGVKNDNVSDFRFALVESDTIEIEKQNALIRKLELPVAALVYSGGKSIHAIVKIDAGDYAEYRKRVDFLYNVCNKNGLKIDTQNKNPSRLSRMPGVARGEHFQSLIDVNIGKSSFEEWKEWIESINDDLPDFESLAEFMDNKPILAEPLIEGVLRRGHKMLVAGASKAGKSFALIELSICIAEGLKWLGNQCAKGKVLYINLELDKASCIHRFFDVYKSMMGVEPLRENLENIDIWNLRGMSTPMDKLVPMLIRRADKQQYSAIILDPIYKVITGDENSASEMSKFCNQFDKICKALECSVIYCHHHSKGNQLEKRSMDRASGSGVFARDPDAILDMVEIEIPENHYELMINQESAKLILDTLKLHDYSVDEIFTSSEKEDLGYLKRFITTELPQIWDRVKADLKETEDRVRAYTGWKIESTLREFRKKDPINVWFKYPKHTLDVSGHLKKFSEENANNSPYGRNFAPSKTPEQIKTERQESFDTAFDAVAEDGKAPIAAVCQYLGISERTANRRVNESDKYVLKQNIITKK